MRIEALVGEAYGYRTKALTESMHFVFEYAILAVQDPPVASYEKASGNHLEYQ